MEARPGRRPGDKGVTGGAQSPGELVVVATPIGNIGDLSPRAAATLEQADVVCCEDTRHTGQLLARLGPARFSSALGARAQRDRARSRRCSSMLGRGAKVALVSDAGTPAVSDPGERLISAAIAAGHKVTTVPGPSAAVSALVVAGLGTTRWRFEGFLPRRGPERAKRLGEIAAGRAPERDLRVAPADRRDPARPRCLVRRRPAGGGLPRADQALRGDLARDPRRGVPARPGGRGPRRARPRRGGGSPPPEGRRRARLR